MSDWLFEDPWALVVGLLAGFAVLRIVGKRRGDRPGGGGLLGVSWVLLVLSLGVYGLSRWVETDGEAVDRRTRELVEATWPVDEPALAGLLEPDAVLLGPGGEVWDELSAGFIAAKLKQHRVEGSGLRRLDAQGLRAGVGRSRMEVSSRVSGYPARTGWELSWRESPDGVWRLQSMTWLTFRDQPASRSLY